MKQASKTTISKRSRRQMVHYAILDAAAEILKKDGYSGFTIEKIAKKAGAGKPTIYRWWPNKTTLLIEVFERETNSQLIIRDRGSTEAELADWFKGVWRAWRSPIGKHAFRSILAEIQADEKALDFFNRTFVPRRRELLLEILRRAQQRGELKGRDIEVIVDYCWGFNWYHLLTHATPKKKQINEVITTALQNHR